MNTFERYLSLWIALAIVAGIALGSAAPGLVNAIAAAEVASVNLVVAALIWAMVYPMMVGVDLSSLRDVFTAPNRIPLSSTTSRFHDVMSRCVKPKRSQKQSGAQQNERCCEARNYAKWKKVRLIDPEPLFPAERKSD